VAGRRRARSASAPVIAVHRDWRCGKPVGRPHWYAGFRSLGDHQAQGDPPRRHRRPGAAAGQARSRFTCALETLLGSGNQVAVVAGLDQHPRAAPAESASPLERPSWGRGRCSRQAAAEVFGAARRVSIPMLQTTRWTVPSRFHRHRHRAADSHFQTAGPRGRRGPAPRRDRGSSRSGFHRAVDSPQLSRSSSRDARNPRRSRVCALLANATVIRGKDQVAAYCARTSPFGAPWQILTFHSSNPCRRWARSSGQPALDPSPDAAVVIDHVVARQTTHRAGPAERCRSGSRPRRSAGAEQAAAGWPAEKQETLRAGEAQAALGFRGLIWVIPPWLSRRECAGWQTGSFLSTTNARAHSIGSAAAPAADSLSA